MWLVKQKRRRQSWRHLRWNGGHLVQQHLRSAGSQMPRPLGGGNRPSISPGLPNDRLFFSSESLIFPAFPCISMHFQYLSGVKDGEGKCFHIRCILSGLGGQYCRHVQLTVSRWTALQNAEKSTKMLV